MTSDRVNEILKLHYAEKDQYLDELILNSEGNLKNSFKERMYKEFEKPVANFIIDCYDQSKSLDDAINSFAKIQDNLKYHFMSKNELINTLNNLENKYESGSAGN